MMIALMLTDGDGASLVLVLAAGAGAQSSSTNLDDYAVFADHGIRTRGMTVFAGDVGVNQGPFTSTRSFDAPSSSLVADRVDLDPASRCAGLFAASGQATAGCGPLTAHVGPIVTDLETACGFPQD